MSTTQPTKRVIVIGRALLGYTADVESDVQISGAAQHTLLSHASKGELLAAKMLIEQYHPEHIAAIELANGYISLKAESGVWSIAS